MSPDEFIERATPWLTEEELKALTNADANFDVAAEWALWERSFRSAVAQVRAAKLGKEFQVDRLKTDVMDGATRQGIAELYKTGEPLKIERGLDLLSFSRLDEMSAGHFFDYHPSRFLREPEPAHEPLYRSTNVESVTFEIHGPSEVAWSRVKSRSVNISVLKASSQPKI